MKQQTFGEYLRELRIAKHYSQRELAREVSGYLRKYGQSFNYTYLSKIEGGARSPPSIRIISGLAEILSVTDDEIFMLAGRLPPWLEEKYRTDKNVRRVMKEIPNMTDDELKILTKYANRLKKNCHGELQISSPT